MTYPLTRPARATSSAVAPLDLGTFARITGLHPELVRRFVELGLLDAGSDPTGELSFTLEQVRIAARVGRLRAGFALNYAAIDLVMALLDRIEELESARSRRPRHRGGPPWT
jgi:chaperone modulatory protein CbpM